MKRLWWHHQLRKWLYNDQFSDGWLWAHNVLKTSNGHDVKRFCSIEMRTERSAFNDGFWQRVEDER